VDRQDRRERTIPRRDLDQRQSIADIVHPGPAHSFRRGHAHQAKLRQFQKEISGIGAVGLMPQGIGIQPLPGEIPHHLLHSLLGVRENHKLSSLFSTNE
jgi:hypothetical protein